MKIQRFEILIVEIPMRMTVRHTLAERKVARNILLAAHDADGAVGWGESCPRPYVTGETVESALRDLQETILPHFIGASFADFEELKAELLAQVTTLRRDQQAAFCACELALLDLLGKSLGRSAGEVLGPAIHSRARYSGVIATEEPEAVKNLAGFMKKFGVGAVKVKTGPTLEGNRVLLTACRDILGPEVELRIDANSAWNGAETVAQLRKLADFQLAGCEQPVPGDDYAGMATATAANVTPIAADESLCSFADAERLIRERGCDIFNLRVSKCGGLLNAARLRDLATTAGLRCQLGAQVGETGILSAAGRHLATRSADLIWHEGSYGALLLEQDLTVPDITVGPGGWAPALDAPGLGVAPDPEPLRAFTTETFTIPVP